MRKVFVSAMFILSTMLSFGNGFAASDVESRVTVLEGKVVTLEQTVASQQTTIQNLQTSLQTAIAALQVRVDAMENNPAVQIGSLGYMRLDTNVRNGVIGPHVIFEGVNLHLQNGVGGSEYEDPYYNPPNGLGNLIVGYTSVDALALEPGDRSGSHNLVIGHSNKFPGISSIVHGWNNTATEAYSATIAGDSNIAGKLNAVVGGHDSVAIGLESVVVGGNYNNAQGAAAVIVGGGRNTAGEYGAILGGTMNTANFGSIVGGEGNSATGAWSTVTGGTANTAAGYGSSISGGSYHQVTGEFDWAAGSLWEDQ